MKHLSIQRSWLLVLAVCAVAAAPAHADEWSKTYTVSGKPDLRVETSDANIRVTTWDQNTIEAKVTTTRYKIGDGGIRVEERQNGDSVEIDVRYPHHDFVMGWSSHRVDIIIQMPREGHVKPQHRRRKDRTRRTQRRDGSTQWRWLGESRQC